MSFCKSIRLSALSLLLATGIAGAANATPINYNINFNIGTAQVTGTIKTDGTLGALTPQLLNPSQILDWSLTVSDPAHTCAALGGGTGACTVAFQGPFGTTFNGGLQTDSLVGNALMATASQLYFDPLGIGFLRFNSIPGGEVCVGVGKVCAIIAGYDASVRLNPGHKLFTTPGFPNGADYQRQNFCRSGDPGYRHAGPGTFVAGGVGRRAGDAAAGLCPLPQGGARAGLNDLETQKKPGARSAVRLLLSL